MATEPALQPSRTEPMPSELPDLLRVDGPPPRGVIRTGPGTVIVLGVDPGPSPTGDAWPLDWAPPWPTRLPAQDDVLWLEGPAGERVLLPHQVLLGPWSDGTGRAVAVAQETSRRHVPPWRDEGAGAFWRAHADARGLPRPYDPPLGTARLARFVSSPPALHFQPVNYTDYVRTNLGLDGRASLRAGEVREGRLVPLDRSGLANTVGLGILVFSSDGALVLQRRAADGVLFAASQIASAGSGTLDWSDVQGCLGGVLGGLDLYREVVEEVGVPRSGRVELLGLTRELVRYEPGLWAAADLDWPLDRVLLEGGRRRTDREGEVLGLHLGSESGRARPRSPLDPAGFWELVGRIAALGPLSIPLWANLALWWIAAAPDRGGRGSIAELT